MVVGNCPEACVVNLARLISGDCIMDGGVAVNTVHFMNVHQRREYKSCNRDERFMVGWLRKFGHSIKDGHDVFIGCIFCVRAGQGKCFAVARVIGIVDDKDQVWSLKFSAASRTQR